MVRVLALRGTGSVGQLAVHEALAQGHDVVALVRDRSRAARLLPAVTTLVEGDLPTGDGIIDAVDGIDAVISTLDGDAHLVGCSVPHSLD